MCDNEIEPVTSSVRTSCMEVNTGRWCSSRAYRGRMRSVLDGEVAVYPCCIKHHENRSSIQGSARAALAPHCSAPCPRRAGPQSPGR